MQSYLLNVSFPPGVWIELQWFVDAAGLFLWSTVSGIGVSLGYFAVLAGFVVGITIAVAIYFQQRIKIHYAVQRVLSVRDECAQEMLALVEELNEIQKP